ISGGCGQADGQAGAPGGAGGVGAAAPAVVVTSPVERDVIDAKIFPNARVQATDFVEVRARVGGYLTKMYFQPGAEVKAGTPLFEIDPSTYQAVLDRSEAQLLAAEAQVQVYEARVARLRNDLDRDEALLKTNSLSEQDVNATRGNYAEAVAGLAAAKADVAAATAAVDSARLDLQFTEVISPIDGMVSRELVTLGNLVTQGTTKLTEIVSMDPIHVYFDIDIHTMLELQKMVMRGEIRPASPDAGGPSASRNPDAPEKNEQAVAAALVEVGLPGEGTFPTVGRLDFSEPSVNQTMGVLTMRAEIANPMINGVRRYIPGIFATVRIPISTPYRAMVIPEEAIGTDQNINYVLVVDSENTVEFRQVILGNLQPDNTRVVQPYDENRHTGL
ncbi:MAG: efflux RND transporter periplasmic adaptor subunit, partial [Planctomycetia bacterium]|nr:efflux RND transporter periplasmic adaptor subunit [Planctomycetia bacterium]